MALSTATSSTSLASAEASAHEWKYEVFLSFRGVDTRQGITSAIYNGLQNMREIETFMDGQKIQVGDDISPTLLTAIKESRFAIVVLSQRYADSAWCLEELATIFQCMKDKSRILPLFYGVDSSDVRYQKGSFESAFTKHEFRHGIENVKHWKEALINVANLSGWHSNNYQSDQELVEDIVKFVYSKVLQVRIEASRDFEVFDATKLALDKVMEGLQDDEVTVIGLYGIGGVGKTTLVKHAGAQAREKGLFNTVIMAVVPQSLDLKKIQYQLADALALNFRGHTEEEGIAAVLQETILRRNKLLIILDDIWTRVPLSSIGIPNHEELQKCSSKVLLTTRIPKVCQVMHSDVNINLSILSEEDSWKLFFKKAKIAFQESTEIYTVATKVARNCGGLPVALTSVAIELRGKDLDEWKKVAERLHGSQFSDLEDERYLHSRIKLSYEYLKSTDEKLFLLLCCLFPQQYDIPIEDLFRYGIGKGLFVESSTLQEARATADLVVESLKASNLLLDSEKKGCVKMHDVTRDVVMSISSSENGQQMLVKSGHDLIDWNADSNYFAISLMDNKINIPKELVCSKLLQILLVKGYTGTKFSVSIFKVQNDLRVLDLRNTARCALNFTIDGLTNVRSLLVESLEGDIMKREEFAHIFKVGKLELLSMTWFKYFPEELGQLSKLRMLDVSNARHDMFPPQVISRLINLEELYMKGKFIWGCKYHKEYKGNQTDLCCEEFVGLPKLNVLEVQIHDVGCLPKVVEFNPHWVKFDFIFNANNYSDYLQYLAELPQHERSLCLDTTINNLPDWFQKVVTESAKKLVYYWFRDMTNILVEYSIGRLHGVKYLAVIRYNSQSFSIRRGELMNAVTWDVLDKPVFKNLETLHVEEVPYAVLCVGELPVGSFSNLKKLTVMDCSNMKDVLLSSNLLKRLQNLEELVCADMSRIKYVFGTDGMETEQIICTKLRKLHLKDLPKLIDICNGPALPHAIFQNLKSLAVGNCPTWKYVLLSRSVVECLVQLEELYVYGCPNLKAVIRAYKETDIDDDMIEFSNLKILFLENLFSVPRFYGTTGSRGRKLNCPKLEQICVINCFHLNMDDNISKFRKLQQDDGSMYSRTRKRLFKESNPRRNELDVNGFQRSSAKGIVASVLGLSKSE